MKSQQWFLYRRKRYALVLLTLIICVVMGGLLPNLVPLTTVYATGIISGAAFQDYNSNGTRDTTTSTISNEGAGTIVVSIDGGVAGVTVTAYDRDGNAVGTDTTAADGTYSIDTLATTGPYRVEFTNLPTGYSPGPQGPDSGTNVQFVPEGGATDVNFGLVRPEEHCEDNPLLITNCYAYGDYTDAAGQGPNANGPVVISFPYSSGTDVAAENWATDTGNVRNPTSHDIVIPHSDVGTTWGLSYARESETLYVGAFMKRHSGYGPSGPGAIYEIDTSAASFPGTASLFADLQALDPGAAPTDAHDTADFYQDNDDVGWDGVGKTGLGGLALNTDETNLYVMALENRTLYDITVATGTLARTGAQVPLNPPGCPDADDVRPFAVTYYRGLIYVGMVCTAESTVPGPLTRSIFINEPANPLPGAVGDLTALQAYVYSIDPASTFTTGDFNLELTIPLDYENDYRRGQADATGFSAAWLPWYPQFVRQSTGGQNAIYPQPWLTDIAFDSDENMILGIRDRMGDATGFFTESDPDDATLMRGITAGDLLRACGTVAGGWTLESNGTCGGITTAGADNGQGPGDGADTGGNGGADGDGEYYYQDDYADTSGSAGLFHDELGLGGLLQIPGRPHVLNTVFDPAYPDDSATQDGFLNSAGVRWMFNDNTVGTAGSVGKTYEIFDTPDTPIPPPTFGKAGGLGDLEALCEPAPIQVGNRIWRDELAGNGRQDSTGTYDPPGAPAPREVGVNGVTVELFDVFQGIVVATTVTSSDGNYYFNDSDIAGDGFVEGRQYEIRVALGQTDSDGTTLNTLAPQDATGSDINDSDAQLASIVTPDDYAVILFTAGGPGENNHDYDIGFTDPEVPTAVKLASFTATPQSALLRGVAWGSAGLVLTLTLALTLVVVRRRW